MEEESNSAPALVDLSEAQRRQAMTRFAVLRPYPRDLSEIRVFHRNQFLCRAVSEEHAAKTVTLKDIAAARRAHRRALRTAINERVARVADFLPGHADLSRPATTTDRPTRAGRVKLRLYEDGQ